MVTTAVAHERPSTTSQRCWTQLPEGEALERVAQLALLKGNGVLLRRRLEVMLFALIEFESAPAHDLRLPRRTKRTSTPMPNFPNTLLQTLRALLDASVGAARLLQEILQLELALRLHPARAEPALALLLPANASHPLRSSANSPTQALARVVTAAAAHQL